MSSDELLGQAEHTAQRPHFVFEQFAQRLHQLHLHSFLQSADIVVRFDCHRRTFERDRLDHVRIERALGQEFDLTDFLSFFFKDINKSRPDDLALLLRICHPGQP